MDQVTTVREELRLTGDGFTTLATLFSPSDRAPSSFLVFFPGGGSNRNYIDLHPRGLAGYSQAEHHTAAGVAVLALNHAVPSRYADTPSERVREAARLDALAVENALQLIDSGASTMLSSTAGLPRIGLGHSMGSSILTVAQAEHRLFDRVALVGWSATKTALATPPPEMGDIGFRTREHFRWAYHWDEEEDWLVDDDLTPTYPDRTPPLPLWASTDRPIPITDVLIPGFVTEWAAKIDVPVLLCFAERDVVADPGAEAAFYESSPHVDLVVAPRTAHVYNFAPGRRVIWDAVTRFCAAATETARQA